jgi:hypothetical protein
MPLARFRQAQVGMRVTLGAKLPEITDKRRGDPTAPVINPRTAEKYFWLLQHSILSGQGIL